MQFKVRGNGHVSRAREIIPILKKYEWARHSH